MTLYHVNINSVACIFVRLIFIATIDYKILLQGLWYNSVATSTLLNVYYRHLLGYTKIRAIGVVTARHAQVRKIAMKCGKHLR